MSNVGVYSVHCKQAFWHMRMGADLNAPKWSVLFYQVENKMLGNLSLNVSDPGINCFLFFLYRCIDEYSVNRILCILREVYGQRCYCFLPPDGYTMSEMSPQARLYHCPWMKRSGCSLRNFSCQKSPFYCICFIWCIEAEEA